jgi:hypothetical protein
MKLKNPPGTSSIADVNANGAKVSKESRNSTSPDLWKMKKN